ncbi:hypothetical protein PHYBLDRAFT_73165 [Phycomyces blakesleeanus NRRL 1555(-)]|uniref:Uncharacterized protein n=1 Tax=Phycomyces blakesleeanus (strain ATCC 8743b / DSM 1359 / FGSC 10004 / NBRC 33097 / NRRL 1555) TaxID=763407 RepID=A0A162N647_PHYB8|nr:hypothetical protein PHYBLDRAFT_73165 [Phycomyces blakesleeanus NRRL 1555(-)]OAD66154.1 hypothetical protein PHYBLDRAFT_73165 [Phycomyces blakesleeanus NRRL 1555(-)]|eukprot:XP_018284194.1 hypothetical protein PHYBLDRAFT_73165 [Phycomyces blakesleeanus NRRL 1555(-)]
MSDEEISHHTNSMDVDLDFDQDMSIDIKSPSEASSNYFCVCNVVKHRNSSNHSESNESDLAAINALMSHYKMDTLIKSKYTVRPVTYDVCQKDCIHFDTIEAGQYADEKEYERENMIQLAIIPGPKHPKNIVSFLEPIVKDLHMLQTSGLKVQTISGQSLCQFEGNRYGINGPNIFRNLNTLTSSTFFRLDKIHLISHKNVQIRHSSKLHWQLEITEENNWLNFLLFVMPTVVIHKCFLAITRRTVLDLVLVCSIAQQWEVTEEEIHAMESSFWLYESGLLLTAGMFEPITLLYSITWKNTDML